MARIVEDSKSKLRQLRDRLAAELPRARTRPNAPPSLIERLDAALEVVTSVYSLQGSSASTRTLDEVYEDAVVEAHLALHEWERWLEQEHQQKKLRSRTLPSADRRAHERHDTDVTVKLLRYRVRADDFGDVTIDSEVASRPARNLSLGGLFVSLAADELPAVKAGSVLHVFVSFGAVSFTARATVQRRDSNGAGLRWVGESDRVRRSVESLLDAVRRARTGR